jgi:hypothetical protein
MAIDVRKSPGFMVSKRATISRSGPIKVLVAISDRIKTRRALPGRGGGT